MAPVELLDVKPGERVLDLCAAPGGKSTQIAAKLQGNGVFVVNDNHSDRVRALVKNLELFGARNAVVLNEKPERMIGPFAGYFGKILIDAPCSGEGMFRKEEDMMSQWQRHSVTECSLMQRELLGQAAQMLAPGGTMVYSTCTFSPEENEAQIAEFLDGWEEFEVVRVDGYADFGPGRPDWVRAPWCSEGAYSARALAAAGAPLGLDAAPAGAARVAAAADGAAGVGAAARSVAAGAKRSGRDATLRGVRARAASEPEAAGRLVLFGEHAYASPEGLPELGGVKIVRPGWYIGSLHRGRFEPSHAFAMGLRMDDVKRAINLVSGDGRVIRYLKGETLEISEEEVLCSSTEISAKGYCLICIDGFSIGWGKWSGGLLKNEYPPGWRWT